MVGDPPSSQKKADNSLNFAVYIQREMFFWVIKYIDVLPTSFYSTKY